MLTAAPSLPLLLHPRWKSPIPPASAAAHMDLLHGRCHRRVGPTLRVTGIEMRTFRAGHTFCSGRSGQLTRRWQMQLQVYSPHFCAHQAGRACYLPQRVAAAAGPSRAAGAGKLQDEQSCRAAGCSGMTWFCGMPPPGQEFSINCPVAPLVPANVLQPCRGCVERLIQAQRRRSALAGT